MSIRFDPEIITGALVTGFCWLASIGLIVYSIFMDGGKG